MRADYYKLEGHTPVPTTCDDAFLRWDATRIVAQTVLPSGTEVSTVFMCINHNFFDDGPPIVFETMVFARNSSHLPRPDEEALAMEISTKARTVRDTFSMMFRRALRIDVGETPEGARVEHAMDGAQDRYCTWEEAERGHAAMVARVIEWEYLSHQSD